MTFSTSGVAASTASSGKPEYYWSFRLADRHEDEADARDAVLFRAITGDYFAVLGMDVVEGRGILPSDVDGAPRVAWVNRAFVARYLPGGTVLGQRLVSPSTRSPATCAGASARSTPRRCSSTSGR